jgi:hypothetical protein
VVRKCVPGGFFLYLLNAIVGGAAGYLLLSDPNARRGCHHNDARFTFYRGRDLLHGCGELDSIPPLEVHSLLGRGRCDTAHHPSGELARCQHLFYRHGDRHRPDIGRISPDGFRRGDSQFVQSASLSVCLIVRGRDRRMALKSAPGRYEE